MIPEEELRAENQAIGELCAVLECVIKDDTLKNNAVVCELVDRFVDNVSAHLVHESRDVYRELLNGDQHERHVAEQFIDNTHELERITSSYNGSWCRLKEGKGDFKTFRTETSQMVRLVCSRIGMENDRLFPLIKEKARQAALPA